MTAVIEVLLQDRLSSSPTGLWRDKNNPCREPGLQPPTRRSRWLRELHAGVTPHAEKSPALFDEATEDPVLGIEDVPAEASSRFTKQQEQREAMPGGPRSRHSWRPVRCRRCSPWRLLRLGHVSTARAVAERQSHRQPRLAVYFSQSTGLDGPRVRPSVMSQVLTNRVGGSISTYVPRHEHSLPPGVTKTGWNFPPTAGRSHGSSPCLPPSRTTDSGVRAWSRRRRRVRGKRRRSTW